MKNASMSAGLTAQKNNLERKRLFCLIRVFAIMLFLTYGVSPASGGIRIFSSAEGLQYSTPDVSTNTIANFTPATGAGCKLVVCASWESKSSAGISSVTYAGLNLIKAVSADEIQRSSIWYLDLDSAAPTNGDVVVTFQTPTDSRIGVLSLQETAPGAPAQTVSLSDSNTASLTTTSPDALVVGVYTENDEPHAISSTFANTLYSGNSGSSKGLAGYQHEFNTGLKSYTWDSHYTNNYSTVVLAAFTHEAVIVENSKQNYEASGSALTNTINNFTVPLGVNRKLVVTASWEGGASITNISYGSQTLTEAVTSSNARKASIWYLDAPAFGTADIVVSFSSGTASRIGAVSFENVAPGAPAQTNAVSGTTNAVLTTTSADAMVVGVYTEDKNPGGWLVSSDFRHELYSGGSGGSRGYAGFQSEPNAGLKSYTINAVQDNSVIALAAFDYIEPTNTLDPEAIDFVINDTHNRQRQKHLLTMGITPADIRQYEEYALSAYWLNTNNAIADAGLVAVRTNGMYQATGSGDPFHWHAFVQSRIYLLYSSQSEYYPDRMSTAAEDSVLQMLWGWASNRCEIGMFDPDTTFYSWGSENHHSMAWVGYWNIAQIMAGHPIYSTYTYADGTTPAAMAAAANEYYKAYVRHRTLNAPMIEAAAPAYNTITMNTWLNLADFATDPDLKAAASSMIDIYWANWAIEQINGVRGGSRNRCKPGSEAVVRSACEEVAWYFFGIGNEPIALSGAVGATALWRPSRAVVGLALDPEGRGEYSYISRRLGHKDPKPMPVLASPGTEFSWNPLDPEGGHLLRYTWSTPDFVMGTAMMSKLPSDEWIGFSSQDRWNGTIFKGPNTSRIFTQVPYNQNGRSVYNTEWGVQNQGVSILQRIPTDVDADGQMVWFSLDLNRQESGGWIFAEALDAFAAVKIADGNWTWTPDGDQFQRNDIPDDIGEWAVLDDEYCPIIMEVARKEDYNGSMSQFMQDILDNTLTWTNNKLDYTSSGYGITLTLFTDYSALPQVDGVTIDLAPPEAYQSPYLNGEVAEGPVIIEYGDDRTIHGVATGGDTSLKCWLKLDEGSGTTAADSSGYGNHGTITGGAWAAGQLNGAYDFTPTSYITMPATTLNAVDQEITIALWVYGDTTQPANDSIFHAVDASGNRVLNVHLPWGDGKVYWDAGSGGYDRINKICDAAIYKGSWHHWAFVKNASTGSMKIYLDGVLWHSGTGKTKSMTGITAFNIGNTYDGKLDDVRIYYRALSATEIADLTSGGGSPVTPGIRVTEYYVSSSAFSGTNATLTLDQSLESDYYILVRGSREGDGESFADNNYARVTAVPGGKGDLPDSGAANQIILERLVADYNWEGVVTVVECGNSDSTAGFKLIDVASTALSGTSGTDTVAPWADSSRVVLFGGYRGGGVAMTAQTTVSRNQMTSAMTRLYPSGSNTLNWTRDAGGETLVNAIMTTFVVEWGSEWTVQRVNVAGSNGGDGADATNEYTAVEINAVNRDNTWIWATGTRSDAGIGDSAEGCLITLGDGVNQNASESKVAVGSEYTDAYNFDVYVMTHSAIAVDHRFKVDGDSDALDLPVTVDPAAAGARFGWVYNGVSADGTGHPRELFWARYTADDSVTISRGCSYRTFPAWVQGIDLSGLNP